LQRKNGLTSSTPDPTGWRWKPKHLHVRSKQKAQTLTSNETGISWSKVSSSPVALWLETETAGNGSAYAAQACREARAPPLSGCDQGINFQAHLLALCGACCRGPCRRFTYRPALVRGGSITRASATPFASSSLAGRTVSCTELPRISLAIHHPLWISTNRTIISHLPDIRNRASIGKTDPPWPPGPANGPLSANCSRHCL
jgi:hypothetical protein